MHFNHNLLTFQKLTQWMRVFDNIQRRIVIGARCYASQSSETDHVQSPRFRKIKTGSFRLLNYKLLNVDHDNVTAVVKHPGLSYADHDYNGHPKLWKIMKALESVRYFAHHYPLHDGGKTFRDYAQLTDDCLIFFVTAEVEISKEMYDLDVPKFPLHIAVQSGYIGKTSFNTITKIYNEENKQLCSNTTQTVMIDKTSRRPKPLPVWWREKYAVSSKPYGPLILEKFKKSEDPDSYQTNVAWSDTDVNCHTNWTTYARVMVDAAHHCARTGKLQQFNDNFQNGIHRARFHFYGESSESDILTVNTWPDAGSKKTIYFDVENKDVSICQCIMSFH